MSKLNRMSDLKPVQSDGQAIQEALSLANVPQAGHKSTEAHHYGKMKPKKKKKKKRTKK
jgi:hypothetical protein